MRTDKELLHFFAKRVREMREAQTEFFRARRAGMDAKSKEWLTKARTLEGEVDRFLESLQRDKDLPSLF